MGLNEVLQTGRTGLMAAKSSISTAGHNISNANTEGFSRQRVNTETVDARPYGDKGFIGRGVRVADVKRMNDTYLEKQIREVGTERASSEERDMMMSQVEDIFNEMNGDGLNRLVSQFFNQFRQLANDPSSNAIREAVRESSSSLVNDFKRIREELIKTQDHIDSKLTGYSREANALTKEIRDLNMKIKTLSLSGASPNDLLDKRDVALKNLAEIVDVNVATDESGGYIVDLPGVGSLVSGPLSETFETRRSPNNQDIGKRDNSVDIVLTGGGRTVVTQALKKGRMGGLIDLRDNVINDMVNRLDQMAFDISGRVNQIHEQGVDALGNRGASFFKTLESKDRAAEFLDLSDKIKESANHIAAAVQNDAPGDNRVASAIAGLQGLKLMGDGTATFDDWFNGIVADAGVIANSNKEALNQQNNIFSQLSKIREQISGVSLDEETSNLLQFQHIYDASARVIRIADEMLDTVLKLKPL